MHWLLLLALMSSTTDMKSGGSSSTMSRLAEQSLRRQLGTARGVDVQVTPGRAGGGDIDLFNVSLDGFSLDRLANLDSRSTNNNPNNSRGDYDRGDYDLPGGTSDQYPSHPDDNTYDSGSYDLPRLDGAGRNSRTNRNFDAGDLGDILGGMGKGDGKLGGGLGDILGGVLGGGLGTRSGGRIGRVRLKATNFTFQGARYNSLSADLGEIRFDWKKALGGQMDVKSIAPGSLALSLNGDQLAKLLSPRLPSLRDVKVRFSNGRAFVGAKSGMYGVNVPFEVGARLSVQQNRVVASDFAASVARLRLPSFVLDEVTRGVNPLYDFDPQNRWPLAINLSTAQAGNNVLAMRGGIQWLGFNRDRDNRNRDNRNRDNRDRDNRDRDNRDRDNRDRDNRNADYDQGDYDQREREREDRERDTRNRDRNRNDRGADILGDIFGR